MFFNPTSSCGKYGKMSGMSPWQHISIRPAPPGRFLLSFFQILPGQKKIAPTFFHFVGTISSVSCVENEGLAQRILALVAITSTASGILTSTVLGAALAFGCNSRGFLVGQCLANVLQFLAGNKHDTRLLDVGSGEFIGRLYAFGTNGQTEGAEVVDTDNLTAGQLFLGNVHHVVHHGLGIGTGHGGTVGSGTGKHVKGTFVSSLHLGVELGGFLRFRRILAG